MRRIVRPGEDTPDAKTMSFFEHLDELRIRLVWAVLGLLPILGLALYFGPQLLEIIVRPVLQKLIEAGQPPEMQSTSPFETFFTYIKLAMIATLIVGAPWVLWNLWKFVSPGLHEHERKLVRLMLPMSAVLSALGVAFLWAIALPTTLFFMISFSTDIGRQHSETAAPAQGIVLPQIPTLASDPTDPKPGDAWINSEFNEMRVCIRLDKDKAPVLWTIAGALVKPGVGSATLKQQYKVDDYTDTFLSLALGFSVAFQTPVVVLILGWIGIIDQAFLSKYRRHAIMLAAIVGALATPGDPSMMLLMGIPMWLLYELGSILLRVFPPRRSTDDVPLDPDEGESSPPSGRPPDDRPPPAAPGSGESPVSTPDPNPPASWRPAPGYNPFAESNSPPTNDTPNDVPGDSSGGGGETPPRNGA